MVTHQEFRPGDFVTYTPYVGGEKERGIVKAVDGWKIYVVYKCGDDWTNYKNYTAAMTHAKKLTHGWDENS